MSTLAQQYQRGLADEKKAIAFLKAEGYDVQVSSREQNILQDIDCIIDGKATSIKAEHTGLRYNNIYMELANLLQDYNSIIPLMSNITLEVVELALSTPEWEPGWFYTGTATQYLILQGNSLRLYQKTDIINHVQSQDFLRIRPLTKARKAYLTKYRYKDTLSGFLDRDSIPYVQWVID